MQKIGKAAFVSWVEEVNFKKESVSDMVAIEGGSFNQGDVCHESSLPVVGISAKTDSQGMIYGEMQCPDSRAYYNFKLAGYPRCSLTGVHVHTRIGRQGPIVFDVEIWKCSMNMYTDPLTCFGGSKDSDDRHPRPVIFLKDAIPNRQWRIQLRRDRLIMVDAVEAHAKGLHQAG